MFDKNLTNEEKLDAIYEMTKQNHEVLKTIRRQYYFASVLRILYWLLVLGALGGTYYYIRPFVGMFSESSATNTETALQRFNDVKNQLPEGKIINELFNTIQKPANP